VGCGRADGGGRIWRRIQRVSGFEEEEKRRRREMR
jgi:hypothetical protein